MTQRWLILALTACILALCMQAVEAQELELKAYVDRTQVGTGQQFALVIELSGSDAQGTQFPELPDISAFADYAGSSTSQSYQFINGRMSASKSSVNYYFARTEGKHQIPSVTLSYKGKTLKSQPVTIEIVKGAAAPPGQGQQPGGPQPQITPESSLEGNLFLEAEADRKEVYPNQPVIIIYKMYTRVQVTGLNVTKMPKTAGFWSEDFPMPQQLIQYEKIINGKKFLVAEIKKTAFFATEAGDKVIDPMELECEVRLQEQRSSRDFFDQFFRNSFGRMVRARIASKPITIQVHPFPDKGKPADFSGAVGTFSMKTSIDKDQVKTDEAVTLKVSLSGSGNIKTLAEPKISFPQGIEKYDPKVNEKIERAGNTVSGSKAFEYVLIPRLTGEHHIKPFTFSYFDPVKTAYKTIASPEFTIHATAGSGSGGPVASSFSKEEIRIIGRDIRFIKMSSARYYPAGNYFYQTTWFLVLLIVPLFVLGIAIGYRQKINKMADNVAYARSRRANQEAKKRLSRAHKLMKPETQKEFYAELSRALLGYIADKLNLSAAGLISDEVAEKLKEQNIDEQIISMFLESFKECDYQRFAPSQSNLEDMKKSYDRAHNAIRNL